MVKEKITEEKQKAINEIRKQIDEPQIEERKIKLIKNTYKANKKTINQFKITVPLKYLDIVKLNEENCEVTAFLDKKQNKINIEIKKHD